MFNVFEATHGPTGLRQRAVKKLNIGKQAVGQRASQSEALAVLHRLASSPEGAGDALALLHELQVHQVELDLQQEELQRSLSELALELKRQTDRVERAPVGYVTLDAQTVLYEINLAGARLLGAAREDLLGRRLAELLPPASVDTLQAQLGRTQGRRRPESFDLPLMPIAGLNRTVLAAAEQDTTPERFLLVLMTPAVPQPSSTAT